MIQSVENPQSFRENIRNKLNVLLDNPDNSNNLEIGIYNWAINEATIKKVIKSWHNKYFIQLYVDHLRSIIINLSDPDSNLVTHLNEGYIKPHAIACMTHQKMQPDKWKNLLTLKQIRDNAKTEINIEAATDSFKCRKCYGRKCTYYQMQCRSADEPMTTFVSCIDCGNRWKC